jgi:hypothetical protein
MGDREIETQIRAEIAKSISPVVIRNNQKKAGNTVISGTLECIGHPGIEAKKCITVLNVGSEASGKWYVKKCSQRYNVKSGYHTFCELMRATLGKDGQPIEQPVVMYANIYEKDSVTIKCRDVDAESQATFTFGQPPEGGDELLIDFTYSIKLQRGRGAGEQIKSKGWAINEANKLQKNEAGKQGSWNPDSGQKVSAADIDGATS